MPDCIPCDRGKYAYNNSSVECIFCENGRYQNQTTSLACKQCLPGKFLLGLGSTNESKCIQCESGKYQNLSASSSCNECPNEYASGPSFKQYVLWNIGEYWKIEDRECRPRTYICEKGTMERQSPGCVHSVYRRAARPSGPRGEVRL